MTIKEAQQLIFNINQKELQTPVMLIGATGIGKSYSIKDLCKENNLGYIDLRLATQEVTDLIGIPRTVKQEGKEPRTVWTKPDWFPEKGTKGILALEEVNRAPEDVRQAIFQLLTEWRLHTHTLPKGWSIVALINPDNGNYHVNQLGPAFRRRFIQIIIEPPNVIDWSIWAKKNKLEDSVIRFVGQFPKLLNKQEDVNIEAQPTAAGWHMVASLIQNNVIPNKCMHEVVAGVVGIEAATTFVQSLKRDFEKPITAEEILKDYSKVKEKYERQIMENKNALIYSTMIDIIATCDSVKKLDKTELKNLSDYLLDSSSETITNFLLKTSDKIREQLSNNAELLQFVVKVRKEIDEYERD